MAVAWLIRGADGAAAAAIGVAIVVGNFLLSGWMLSRALKISLAVYHAAALFGFVLRLALIAVTMLGVARVVRRRSDTRWASPSWWSYLVLLTLEAVAMTRDAERELEWTN